MKFCDLDGTRLARQAEATGAPAHHRTWSLLGIGLLVGALVLSAVSVFMIPRSRAVPNASSPSSTPPSASKPTESSNPSGSGDNASAAASDQPEIVVAETPPADLTAKKKDRAKPTNENDASPALNPKAAAQTDEDAARPATPPAEPAPAPKKVEPAPAPKAVSETHEPTPTPRTAVTPDPKRDPKHQKDSARDADKKGEEKDKKKGGGFFKVFKKIFGKD